MSQNPQPDSYQLAEETEEVLGTWCRFDGDGEMSIGWGQADDSSCRPLISLDDEALRSLTSILVARYPLEALSQV